MVEFLAQVRQGVNNNNNGNKVNCGACPAQGNKVNCGASPAHSNKVNLFSLEGGLGLIPT